MAYNFEKALNSGVSPQAITDYLASQGRQDEANTYFNQNSSIPMAKPNAVGTGGLIREIPPLIGFGVGEFLGGPAGAGIGSSVGETVSQLGEKALGQRQALDPVKIAESGIAGTLGGPITKGLGVIAGGAKNLIGEGLKFAESKLEPITNVAKSGLQGLKRILPGISPETAQTIKEFPNEVKALAGQKSLPITPLLERVDAAKTALSQKASSEFESGLSAVKNLYPFGKTGKILIGREMQSETAGLPAALRKFRIGVSQDGSLNFDKFPSAIRSQGERQAIQDAYNLVKNQTDFSVQGVQDTAAALRQATNYVEGNQRVSSAAAASIADAYDSAIRRAYPELGALRDTYAARQQLLNVLDKQISPDNKALSDLLSPAGISKLKNLTKEEYNLIYKDFFAKLKAETGLDLEKELRLYSAAREINPNLIPQDIGGSTIPGRSLGILQKISNPIIGSIHVEAQNLLNSGFGQGLKETSPQVFNFLQKLAEGSVKLGAFEGAKQGMESISNEDFFKQF